MTLFIGWLLKPYLPIDRINSYIAGANVWLLRKRWAIPTVKINGVGSNPAQWPDATYSVPGAAELLGVIPTTVFKYLARGLIEGKQLRKGQPWQIALSDDQIDNLRARIHLQVAGVLCQLKRGLQAGRPSPG